MYKVNWADKKVMRSLENLSTPMRSRVEDAILELQSDPRPHGARMLGGRLKGAWRLRVGDYRVLYDIEDAKREIFILDIGHRREVYR